MLRRRSWHERPTCLILSLFTFRNVNHTVPAELKLLLFNHSEFNDKLTKAQLLIIHYSPFIKGSWKKLPSRKLGKYHIEPPRDKKSKTMTCFWIQCFYFTELHLIALLNCFQHFTQKRHKWNKSHKKHLCLSKISRSISSVRAPPAGSSCPQSYNAIRQL